MFSRALLSSGLLSLSCATSLPPDPVERALYADTLTVVRSQARSEWTVDRLAIDSVTPSVAWSACQVDPERRAGLVGWLDGEIEQERLRAGGSAEEGWRRADKDLDAIETLLELERVRLALTAVRSDDCPFWLEVDPEFAGMQGDAGRVVLFVESRGHVALNLRDGDGLRFSGGGAGRILLGFGPSDRVTLALGVEIGGFGRFDEDGDVTGVLGGALPLIVRFANASQLIDLELAAVTFLGGADGLPPGVRAALAFGFLTPRVGGAFSPVAMFYVGYELHPRRGDDDPFHVIAIGTRIGVDIDP